MSEKDISYTTTKSAMAKFELGVRDLVCVYTVPWRRTKCRYANLPCTKCRYANIPYADGTAHQVHR